MIEKIAKECRMALVFGTRVGWEDISGTRYGKVVSDLTHDGCYNVIADDSQGAESWLVIPEHKLYSFDDWNLIFTVWGGEIDEGGLVRMSKSVYTEADVRRYATNTKALFDNVKHILIKDGPKWLDQI